MLESPKRLIKGDRGPQGEGRAESPHGSTQPPSGFPVRMWGLLQALRGKEEERPSDGEVDGVMQNRFCTELTGKCGMLKGKRVFMEAWAGDISCPLEGLGGRPPRGGWVAVSSGGLGVSMRGLGSLQGGCEWRFPAGRSGVETCACTGTPQSSGAHARGDVRVTALLPRPRRPRPRPRERTTLPSTPRGQRRRQRGREGRR